MGVGIVFFEKRVEAQAETVVDVGRFDLGPVGAGDGLARGGIPEIEVVGKIHELAGAVVAVGDVFAEPLGVEVAGAQLALDGAGGGFDGEVRGVALVGDVEIDVAAGDRLGREASDRRAGR